MRHVPALLTMAALGCMHAGAQLPGRPGSFRFAVIGDSGTGGRPQYEVGARLAEFQKTVSFQIVLMLGDNLYGRERPKDFESKFERPYKPLLERGVRFFAALGNHDGLRQQSYSLFNMGGRRYYSLQPCEGIRLYALDSTRMDAEQLGWLEGELARAGGAWKIVFLHHPLYSSGGRHGSSLALRAALEPLLVKHGVAAVLAGHDHFYERMKPQRGVRHFVVGASAKLRAGNARRTAITETAFDRDRSFLLMKIDGDTLHFQAVSRAGKTVDAGSFGRPR